MGPFMSTSIRGRFLFKAFFYLNKHCVYKNRFGEKIKSKKKPFLLSTPALEIQCANHCAHDANTRNLSARSADRH